MDIKQGVIQNILFLRKQTSWTWKQLHAWYITFSIINSQIYVLILISVKRHFYNKCDKIHNDLMVNIYHLECVKWLLRLKAKRY